jgi:heterodisulfide reductase subunit B
MPDTECTRDHIHCTDCGRPISDDEYFANENDGYSNCCNEIIATAPIADFMGDCYHGDNTGE